MSNAVTRVVRFYEPSLLEAGADHFVAANCDDFIAPVKAITKARGARLVFDPVAGKGVMQLAAVTADHGTVMIAGYLGTDMFGFKDGFAHAVPDYRCGVTKPQRARL
jgi:NADPH:quinone reductase-like Zn-dependent oxidoreductase